jgi:SAM-dependent methyltransferase
MNHVEPTIEAWIQSAGLYRLQEDPVLFERAIQQEIALGETDPNARLVVESIYCDADRAAAFQRFRDGLEFRAITCLLDAFGVRRTDRICEIGGGPGYVAWALADIGFQHLTVLEPSAEFITGTGYLASLGDACPLTIINDLDAFYGSPETYDVVLTRNCIHHFRNITYVAACIRTKLKPGGRWLALREWFADSALEVYQMLRGHPYVSKYATYEFPYSAAQYVEALEMAGFHLRAVIPNGYAASVLSAYVTEPGDARNQRTTELTNRVLAKFPQATVRLYELELFTRRYLRRRGTRFTRPQGWLFQRTELGAG